MYDIVMSFLNFTGMNLSDDIQVACTLLFTVAVFSFFVDIIHHLLYSISGR